MNELEKTISEIQIKLLKVGKNETIMILLYFPDAHFELLVKLSEDTQ